MYLTKVWGFHAPCGPLQFSSEGWRKSAREILADGDLVVLVGTKGEQTNKDEQGRLLGIMEPSREVVSSLDFELQTRAIDFDDEGHYRWPFGLLNKQAWVLRDRPHLEEISSRAFNMDSALGIVALTDAEAAEVLALRRDPVEVLQPIRARARIEGEDAARRRAAPPPSTTRHGIMHMRNAPAYTYVMEIQGTTARAFKIGWAFDYRLREREFNLAAMPLLGGLRYRTRLFHLWDTARRAFAMEQTLLRRFNSRRHPSNREVITGYSHGEIESAWTDYFIAARAKRTTPV